MNLIQIIGFQGLAQAAPAGAPAQEGPGGMSILLMYGLLLVGMYVFLV